MPLKKLPLLFSLLILLPHLLFAQMERKRTVQDGPVEDIFLSGSLIGMSTVSALPQRNMNTMVMHNFGLISGGINDFFGIDVGATVRLGIDYGLTDKLDIGIGRTSRENMVDLRLKYLLLQQLKSDKVPFQIALKGDIGINTERENRFDFTFKERLNFLGSVMIARKFNNQFSLQLAPMISHFNTVVLENSTDELNHTIFGIGIGGRYKWSQRNSVAFEYLPVIGERNLGTKNHAAVSYEIDTGGHVFQIFLMSGQWFTEQHLLARTDTNISDLEFRIGFNINRLFSLGK